MNSAPIVVMTEGFARGMTLNVDAYSKKAFSPDIYKDFDENHRALVASAVDRDTFNSRIFDDFNV